MKEIMDDFSFMVVDDHMLIRKLVTQQLEVLGYNKVDTAINGRDALDKIEASIAKSAPYDIIFIDRSMPILDGMELLRICRSNRALDKTALVMLTGECEKQSVIEALHAGVTSYIIKPVSQFTLIEKMENIRKWLHEKRDANI